MGINRRELFKQTAFTLGALQFPGIFELKARAGIPLLTYSASPYTRWWWFSQPIAISDVTYQLDWAKDRGFGGVEIAWVYSLDPKKPGVAWLGKDWSELVAATKKYADRIGLGCDFTFGTLWPFGGSFVADKDAAKTFDGLSSQKLQKTWENRDGRVIDHLSEKALRNYSAKMGGALKDALLGNTSSLFCDSLEIETDKIWSDGLWEKFQEKFRYDLSVYKDELNGYPEVRYDYRKFVGEVMIEQFFKPFTSICHELGAHSRVQCHGAPVDLLTAYASVDVPESEAILFNPYFSRIAASAAALDDKTVVSAETFTCLYGFPAKHQKEEKLSDMKLLADSLLAHGVNHFIFHGMPFNPKGGNQKFYAAVHIGPDSPFADKLPAFNGYLSRLAEIMRKGRTYSRLAVYLPNEDNQRKDELPFWLRSPGANYYWEMRTVDVPEETRGFSPLWISNSFLKEASVVENRLCIGEQSFEALYVNVQWLDGESLESIFSLASKGVKIILAKIPKHPGLKVPENYSSNLERLNKLPNVYSSLEKSGVSPLLKGKELPPFWTREAEGGLWIFLSHPQARELRYPMDYGFAEQTEKRDITLELEYGGMKREIVLTFDPYQACLIRAKATGVETIDISFKV